MFLEIAHVMKDLEVTILKGLLESRSDKLWARFVIQVLLFSTSSVSR